MNQSLKRNYLYNLAYQILAIIIPIITTPYLARVLGPQGTGTYSYTTSIVAYFVLFGSLGVAVYGQREIAYVQDEPYKKNKIFTELVILRCITMAVGIGIFYFCFGRSGEYSLYFRILTVELVGQAIDISWLYNGLEAFKKLVLRSCIVRIVSLVCTFVFIRTSEDIWIYVLLFALTTLAGNGMLWIRLSKYVRFVRFKEINLTRHIKPMLALFLPQIAIQVYTVLDRTMLGAFLNDMSEVGFYEQSQKIVKILLTVISSMCTVMMPRIAHCFANHDKAGIDSYMYKTFRFLFAVSFPMVFGLVAIAGNFVPLFLGEGYDKVVGLLACSTVLMPVIGMSNIIGNQFLLPTKRQNQYTLSVVAGATVNFILNLLFIRKFMSYGATVATIIAEIVVTGIQMYCVRKDFSFSSIFKMAVKYLLASLVMFLVCIAEGIFIENRAVCILVQLLTGGCVYGLLLFVTKDSLIGEMKGILRRK